VYVRVYGLCVRVCVGVGVWVCVWARGRVGRVEGNVEAAAT
jgi:hypothetical protein